LRGSGSDHMHAKSIWRGKLIKGRHSNLFAAVNDFVKQIEEETLC